MISVVFKMVCGQWPVKYRQLLDGKGIHCPRSMNPNFGQLVALGMSVLGLGWVRRNLNYHGHMRIK